MLLIIILSILSAYVRSQNPCEDKHNSCQYWASRGECFLNPDYMLESCCEACKLACIDKDSRCKEWASRGECDLNPDWMLVNCPHACKVCKDLCEILPNWPFRVDTCVNCVTRELPHYCQYVTESEGYCERYKPDGEIRSRELTNKKDSPFSKYTTQTRPEESVAFASYPIHHYNWSCYADCRLFINKKIATDDCKSCTRNNPVLACYYAHELGSCLTYFHAETIGLEHIKDYFKTNQECDNDCSLRITNGTEQKQNCLRCTENPNCTFVQNGSVSLCVSKESIKPDTSGTVHNNQQQCLDVCEILPNWPFRVDTCVNCVTRELPHHCQYVTESEGYCERYKPDGEIRSRELINKKDSPFSKYTTQTKPKEAYDIHHDFDSCYKDCRLFINKKIATDDCKSCTRNNPRFSCYYAHELGSCISHNHAVAIGLEYIKDYFKINQECANDCGLFNQPEPQPPQQVCQRCTESENCVFKISDQKTCISRIKAGEDNLGPSDYHEHPVDCLEDCSLGITPEQPIFEACVTCLQRRGSCSFYINEDLDYACAHEKPYNFFGCLPITDLQDCSSVCIPEPNILTGSNYHNPPMSPMQPPEPIDFPWNV